jgi:predicted phage-related endonuclease
MQRENILTREIHNLLQGSDDWHGFRFNHDGASEAAAMLGLSKNVTRDELVRMKATGLAKEFSDWVQEHVLDHGHEVETLARPLAEKIIGEDLYPVTLSLGRLSASCDGLNMAETIGWEHKQWNEELAAAVAAGVLPDTHMPQVQQQLMVTGAEKWMFMVSDGTEANMVSTWVYPDAAWFDRIRAGWEQFDLDVANYTQVDHAVKPEAAPAAALPALVVQTEGKVVSSNLMTYQKAAENSWPPSKPTCKTTRTSLMPSTTSSSAARPSKNWSGQGRRAGANLDYRRGAAHGRPHQGPVPRQAPGLEKLVKTRKEQIKKPS